MDTLGQTALHRAALAGHIQTCKLLLSYGADPSIVSLQGFTAAQMGNEAVQQILNGDYRTSNFQENGKNTIFLDHHMVYVSPSLTAFFFFPFSFPENVPTRNSDVDYRFLEAAKAGDLDTVQVSSLILLPDHS